jgi:hypothetical protein
MCQEQAARLFDHLVLPLCYIQMSQKQYYNKTACTPNISNDSKPAMIADAMCNKTPGQQSTGTKYLLSL